MGQEVLVTVIVGSTLAAFAMTREDAWSSWLNDAEQIIASHPDGVRYFAALQLDARGLEPFAPLLDRLADIGGEHWLYSLDDGRTEVNMTNRWRHITFGQNLVMDFCQADLAVSHCLFLAADTAVPPDIIPRMLEMDHPLVAPFLTTYELRGPVVLEESIASPPGVLRPRYPFHVEDAMASAAAIFIARDVFRRIRWRWDLEAGMSDDPCFWSDAKTLLNIPTYVRHDVHATHYPISIGEYASRYRPSDLVVHRCR